MIRFWVACVEVGQWPNKTKATIKAGQVTPSPLILKYNECTGVLQLINTKVQAVAQFGMDISKSALLSDKGKSMSKSFAHTYVFDF